MGTMDEVVAFLIWMQIRSLIPTAILVAAKVAGLLSMAWRWVFLPTISAVFFFASFLLATVLVRLAQETARRTGP
jgi:hypothetical protein